jgi:hypothetical protein
MKTRCPYDQYTDFLAESLGEIRLESPTSMMMRVTKHDVGE